MCNNTKQKIAQALRQLMAQTPFQKITVGNLMDVTGMKRQSFYYHFQDTRDVLMWICRQEVMGPLKASSLPLTEWILYALKLMEQDRAFYRKVIVALSQEFITELDRSVMAPKMNAVLWGGEPRNPGQRFLVEFAAQAVTTRLVLFVSSRRALDEQEVRSKIQYLLAELRKGISIATN